MNLSSLIELTARERSFETITVPGGVQTVEDVQRACQCPREQIIKALLFVGTAPVLVLVTGDTKVDLDALKTVRDDRSLRMATKNEVHRITGYVVGAVSPFGLPGTLDIVADHRIQSLPSVIIGSGQEDLLIKMRQAEFLAALRAGFYSIGLVTDATRRI